MLCQCFSREITLTRTNPHDTPHDPYDLAWSLTPQFNLCDYDRALSILSIKAVPSKKDVLQYESLAKKIPLFPLGDVSLGLESVS